MCLREKKLARNFPIQIKRNFIQLKIQMECGAHLNPASIFGRIPTICSQVSKMVAPFPISKLQMVGRHGI